MATYSFQLRDFPFQATQTQTSQARSADHSVVRLALLAFGSLCWLGLYILLVQRLWQGFPLADQLSMSMVAVLIPLGVILTVSWWQLWQGWRLSGKFGGWPALSLDQLLQLSPSQFEEYVTQRIFRRRGFQTRNTPDVKDGGVDIELIDRYNQKAVVQCKRYRNVVGEETVRELYGTMMHEGAVHGYLVTTARISDPARKWAADKNIEMIDGERLVALGR